MGVGSGRILGKVVNPFPVLYTIYFVRGVRGNGGDVARLLVAFGTEAIVSGREYPFNLKQLVWEIGRGIAISLRCMILQLLVMIVLFFGSFIPLAGLVMPVLTFGVGAYFYGFAFMDYAVERKRFRVKESVRYMRHNAGSVTAIGTVFALSLMIPWGSIVVCSFVSLLSVVAGTVVVEEQLGEENIQKLKDIA